MAVPKYNEMYAPLLKSLADGETHTIKEIRQYVSEQMGLSKEDLSEMLPSGKQGLFYNRLGWTRQYLRKAGLIESPGRGQLVLTEAGKAAVHDADIIDNNYLLRYASFQSFIGLEKQEEAEPEDNATATITVEAKKSPEEILEDAYAELNASLADDLMAEIMKLEPSDFERLVVKLLLAMGYGNGIDDAGLVTQASNDGGIDGIIKEDQLGFSYIYIQAKQWAPDRRVDRPEIQKFAGALQGEKATKGLFITTAQFSSGAKQYADNLHGSTVVLIDGIQLTKLMIKFNLGVSVEHVYEVKRIDTDFFMDGF